MKPSSSSAHSKRIQDWAASLLLSPWHGFFFIFLLSIVLRSLLLPYVALDPAWTISWEAGAVAENLARTGEYANAYALPTGPTAHTIPFYTAVMALIFRLFGVTMAAEYARCVLTIVSFSMMYGLMPWFASRLGVGTPAGFVGALIGVFHPQHLSAGVSGELGEEFVAMALGLLMVATHVRWAGNQATARQSFLLGLGWGAAFHASPPLLLVMLAFVVFELSLSRRRKSWRPTIILAAGVILACTPWAVRNYLAFHDFFFIRSNFGLELRMANHDEAAADMRVMDRITTHIHPRALVEEARKVQQWGEMEYMRRARSDAVNWIFLHKKRFLQLTASRVAHFWFGSLHLPSVVLCTGLLTVLAAFGARRLWPSLTRQGRAVLFLPLASFPLIYYVTAYMPRYRIPVDWILLLLAGSAVSEWFRRREAPGNDCDMI